MSLYEFDELARRLQLEAEAVAGEQKMNTAALLRNIDVCVARRLRRRRRIAATVATSAVIIAALLVGRNLPRDTDITGGADLDRTVVDRSSDAPIPETNSRESEQLVAENNPSNAADGQYSISSAAHARKTIVRVIDRSGRVREVDAVVVSGARSKVAFEDLSPMEREIVRRYLQLQGQLSQTTNL